MVMVYENASFLGLPFLMRDNFDRIFFVSLVVETLCQWRLLLTERICSQGLGKNLLSRVTLKGKNLSLESKFFPLRVIIV